MAKREDDFITTIASYAPLALLGLGALHLMKVSSAPGDDDSGLSDTWGGDGEYALPGNIAPKPDAPPPPNGWCFKKDRRGHLVAVPCGAPASSASRAAQQNRTRGGSNSAPVRAPVTHANTEATIPYVSDTTPKNMPGGAPDISHNQPSTDHSMLIVFGAAALGVALVMRG